MTVKNLAQILPIMSLVCLTCSCSQENPNIIKLYSTINMANTVSPLISKITQDACGYQNMQIGIGEEAPAKGGALIYKVENNPEGTGSSCISGKGNYYYVRCYDWGYEDETLWMMATRDVPLNVYSCIDEAEVEIPYHRTALQKAEIGEKFYR